jgi:hypothetical protein
MSDVWSGGLAYSYFHAASAGHEFGMATLSSDNKTVTTNTDYDNLVSQYAKVVFPTTPNKASAPAASYPACPAWTVSNTLPPTPVDAECSCIQSALSCQFKAKTADFNAIVGDLTGQACGLLAQNGGNCADISANGTTGVYGRLEMCDPRE